MQLKPASRTFLLSSLAAAILGMSNTASAAFIEDSKAAVELRNFYMNRDFRQSGAAQSKAEEWAQGFILKMESGYTEGPVGFGLDAIGLLGVKLDSGSGRGGTGLLPRSASGEPADDYGTAGLTAKAKLSATTLHVGTLQPVIPVLMRNDSRLLPNIYRGAWLQSKEVEGLTLDLGMLDRTSYRDSSDYEEMTVFNPTGGYRTPSGVVAAPATNSSSPAGATTGRHNWPPATTTVGWTASTTSTTSAWSMCCRSASRRASRPTCAMYAPPTMAAATSTTTPSARCSPTSMAVTPSPAVTST